MKQPFAQIRPTRANRPALVSGWAGALLLFLAGFLRGADLPAAVTLDLPMAANVATPSWLGHPEIPATAFASINLPILTPDTSASLYVTVYFQEKTGGFMRVVWNGTQGAQLLSDNFYEDIGMSNQRSLLISASMLVGDGTLTFQSGNAELGIQRIKLEWLQNKTSLVSPTVPDALVAPSVGATQLASDVNGQTMPTQPGAWQDQLVTVPITDHALRIEQGVEFSVDLDKVPGAARLAVKETGLPLGKRLVVWINEQRAGTITPAIPDLQDAGFMAGDNAVTNYIGWRDGSFYVPVALLKEGINTLQLSDEDDTDPSAKSTAASTVDSDTPLAVKAMVLQLNYFAQQAKATFLQPQMTLLPTESVQPPDPTGPIQPSEATSTSTDSSTP